MTTAVGFVLAIVFGLLMGIAVGSSSLVYDGIYPALIGFNTIPKVAIIPILVVWFGVGTIPAIITAFLLSLLPILVNVATGIAAMEPERQDAPCAVGAKRWQIVMKVGLPCRCLISLRDRRSRSPSLLLALSLPRRWGKKGIGNLMRAASSRFELPLAFAGLLVTGVMGIGMYAVASLSSGE